MDNVKSLSINDRKSAALGNKLEILINLHNQMNFEMQTVSFGDLATLEMA